MKILYIDPVFGISGDMMLSALIDAGAPFDALKKVFDSVPGIPAMRPVRIEQGIVSGVHLEIGHSDLHLSVSDMEAAIKGADVEDAVKADALGMLSILVAAESKVHGVSRHEVHFHELSHVDTVIDLLGVAWAMRSFGVERVYCGPVPCGSGTIKTSHGIIPNPPPVTLEILSGHRLQFYPENLELSTPTGATVVAWYARKDETAASFATVAAGCGAGTYQSSRPDILRVFVGESGGSAFDEEVIIIEADIDDMNMEYTGAVADRLRAAGALDVLLIPVYMKKGRTGIRLSVMTREDDLGRFTDMIFSETTTFGLRWHKSFRKTLRREETTVETSYGPVRVKTGYGPSGRVLASHIEFDDIRTIADKHAISYREALEAIRKQIDKPGFGYQAPGSGKR